MGKIIKKIDEYMIMIGVWLSDVFPLIFRPLKFWWVGRMILACGYQDRSNKVVVIYRPVKKTSSYEIDFSDQERINKNFFLPLDINQLSILGGKMFKSYLPEGFNDNVVVSATRRGRKVFSRVIERRKERTIFGESGLKIIKGMNPEFCWENPDDKNYWFSFLTVENERKQMVSAVYTKKECWNFNDINVPYYFHDPKKTELVSGEVYKAVLYAINKYNWVTNIDTLTFIYE